MTVGDALKAATAALSGSSPSPSLDAAVLLAHSLGVASAWLTAHPEEMLDGAERPFFDSVSLRSDGLPVAYITGKKEFWGISFFVSPAVLIPKPDTEILVERAIELIDSISARTGSPVSILDVCTGSGCIAVALASSRPGLNILATDISEPALKVARANAEALSPYPISFELSDLRDGLPKREGGWDLIVSNPPYVPTDTAIELLQDGRKEPLLALDGGTDGLDLVRNLFRQASGVLTQGGYLLCETGEYNAKSAAEYVSRCGFVDIVILRDLEGQDRVVEGIKK